MRSEAWRPAAAACNRSPREAREVARQALRPGCEELAARIRKAPARRCRTAGAEGDGSAAPGEKPPRWSAERRASRVMGRKAPRKRLACRVISAFTRVFDARWHAPRVFRRAPERLSALRPPLGSGERSKVANPGRKNAPRERDGLFDIVRWLKRETRPHPEERACASASAKSKGRARVSKDGDGHGVGPSCFETPRCAWLLSMRARQAHARANLRLWGTIAGCAPLFPDCYLQ